MAIPRCERYMTIVTGIRQVCLFLKFQDFRERVLSRSDIRESGGEPEAVGNLLRVSRREKPRL
jgi:hypothetical protein